MHDSWKRVVGSAVVLVVTAMGVGVSRCDAEGGVGFLVQQTSQDTMGAEAKAAVELARKLHNATLVFSQPSGKCVEQQGKSLALDRFEVLWYHQGDSAEQSGPMMTRRTRSSLVIVMATPLFVVAVLGERQSALPGPESPTLP